VALQALIETKQKLSRKEREEAFRRDIVLDVAERLFAEKGFDKTTVSDIADRSELAKGSLYQLFESKQEIIQALVKQKVDKVTSIIQEVLDADLSPFEKVLLSINTKFEAMWESRDFAKIFINEFHGFNWAMDISILSEHFGTIRKMMFKLGDQIALAQKAGDIRDDIPPMVILAMLGGISNALTRMWLGGEINVSREEAITIVRNMFIDGVIPHGGGKAK